MRKALSGDNVRLRKLGGKGCGKERRDRVNDWQYEAGAAILIRPCRQHCSEQAISIDSHGCPVSSFHTNRVRDACPALIDSKLSRENDIIGANAEITQALYKNIGGDSIVY